MALLPKESSVAGTTTNLGHPGNGQRRPPSSFHFASFVELEPELDLLPFLLS